ncbi:MAG: O-antigen ligase family protein, partial [Candidatus Limnocylindria bacterium]
MLLTVGAAIGVQAWRRGRLIPALRHPVSLGLAVFVGLALVSALINAVPPQVAAVGLAFTLDAAALFYLPRMAGFTLRQSLRAVVVILALVGVAAIGGLSQWILAPDFLGLGAWQGSFGEGTRLTSIFTDPLIFGALLGGMIPFAALGVTSLRRPGLRLISLVGMVVLFMPLFLSFSRGAWVGFMIGCLALAIISWRTFALTIGIGIISLMMTITLPRSLLVPPGPPSDTPAPPQRSLLDSTLARLNEIWTGRDLRTRFILNALPIIGDHPLLGVGPGRYGGAAADVFGTPVYEEYGTSALLTDPQQLTVDNFWLHLLVESGLLGFAAYAGAALAALAPIVRLARHSRGTHRFLLGGIAAGSVALAADSISTMLLEANSVAFVVWLLLGLGSLLVAAKAGEWFAAAAARETTPAA